MISESVRREYAVRFHSVDHYPVNVCMHCGYSDDPESRWEYDKDNDRICLKCAEKEQCTV